MQETYAARCKEGHSQVDRETAREIGTKEARLHEKIQQRPLSKPYTCSRKSDIGAGALNPIVHRDCCYLQPASTSICLTAVDANTVPLVCWYNVVLGAVSLLLSVVTGRFRAVVSW